MKILHVLDVSWPVQRGYSIRAYYITKHQKQDGLEPIVLTSERQGCHDSELVHEGIKYYRTPPTGGVLSKAIFARELSQILRLRNRICEIARFEGIDIIHAHSPSLWGLAALFAGRKLAKKVVYEIRAFWEDAAVDAGKYPAGSFLYNLSRRVETFLAGKANKVVVICEGLKKDLVERNVSPDKIIVVPNGIDTKQFKPVEKDRELLKKYGLEGKIVCEFIGTMFNFEGLELLVQAVERLRPERDNFRVLLVGGGEKYDDIRQLVRSKKLKDIILLAGEVPHARIRAYYSIGDIFVYPRISRRITEIVTPLKPLEAMAMGKAVVASDVSGLKEILRSNEYGFTFRAGDVEDLTQKLGFLLESPETLASTGKRARHMMEVHRDWEDLVKAYKARVYV
jgi:PEP-CTERM/exosortase A-associated glycosyltransferase